MARGEFDITAFNRLDRPGVRGPDKRPRKVGKQWRQLGYKPSQKLLNNLRKWGVKPGNCLNPYGKTRDPNFVPKKAPFREKAMKRTRLRLKARNAVALEAHELQQLARENATLAMETLIEITKDRRAPEATRIAASAAILDRGYGKASQTSMSVNLGNGKNNELTSTELDKRVDKALKRVEELTNRKREAVPSQDRPTDIRKYN